MDEEVINFNKAKDIRTLTHLELSSYRDIVANNGYSVDVAIHPSYGLVREGDGDRQEMFRRQLIDGIGNPDKLTFVFEEEDKIDDLREQLSDHGYGENLIIVPTRKNSPTPKILEFEKAFKQFEIVSDKFKSLDVKNINVFGIGFEDYGNSPVGCVPEAKWQFEQMGYSVNLVSNLCFPDTPK